MGLWINVAFAHAPLADVERAVKGVLDAHGQREAPWKAPRELQYERAATTPWWAVGGFAGAPGWTCLCAAPYDVWTADGGARLGELSRALGGAECWQLDASDSDSIRVTRAAAGTISRAGFLTDELDEGMEFEPSMTLPVLNDVSIAEVCAWAKATYPDDFVWMPDLERQTQVRVHPAELVERHAREDVPGVDAAVHAIAHVFGGENYELVDNGTTIACLIWRERPIEAQPSFALFTCRSAP